MLVNGSKPSASHHLLHSPWVLVLWNIPWLVLQGTCHHPKWSSSLSPYGLDPALTSTIWWALWELGLHLWRVQSFMWSLRLAGLYWALGTVERARLLQEHSVSGWNRTAGTWILETFRAGSITGRQGVHSFKVSWWRVTCWGPVPLTHITRTAWTSSYSLLRGDSSVYHGTMYVKPITDPALHTNGESHWLFLCGFILNSESF